MWRMESTRKMDMLMARDGEFENQDGTREGFYHFFFWCFRLLAQLNGHSPVGNESTHLNEIGLLDFDVRV